MKKNKAKKDKTKSKKKKQSIINESKKKKNKKKNVDKNKTSTKKTAKKLEKAKKDSIVKTTITKSSKGIDDENKAIKNRDSAHSPKTAESSLAKAKTAIKAAPTIHRVKSKTMMTIDNDAPTDITSIITSVADALYAYFSKPYILKDGSSLSPAEARTLSFICAEDGATLTMIATGSGATKSAATKPVNRLIEKSMLIRKPMPGNGREKLIVATDKGKSANNEMKILKSERLGKLAHLEENLSESQIEGLKNYLKTLFTLIQ